PHSLLDTHIHLWPSTATSPTDHAWMSPGHKLAQRHGISDYQATTSSSPVQPKGFVYVETDRFLPALSPDLSALGEKAEGGEESGEKADQVLRQWAKEPLNELKFLRRIVERRPEEGDGFTTANAELVKGLVIWAPFPLPTWLFKRYLGIAGEVLGEEAWGRVVGFRYLLQGKGVEGVRSAAESEAFVDNLVVVAGLDGGRGKAFDVGVDCHRDGVEAVEVVGELRRRVGEKVGGEGVRFVLNHLCKPNLSIPHTTYPSYPRWTAALSALSTNPNIYMKLSGAFNEFAPNPTPSTPSELLETLTPYFSHVYEAFGAKRLMFASDWPVCNVCGPKGEAEGEERNWSLWRSVVKAWMDARGLGEEEKEWVWWRSGVRAYGIEG
ncbi:hypothetical protein CC80DRAFT_389134, partial [Byssothecium circinans]